MTKHVLLLGVVGVAFYTGIWVVLNGDNEPTPFTRTGPFFQLWFVCLLIAVVSDAFICPAAKRAASAFAACSRMKPVSSLARSRSRMTGERIFVPRPAESSMGG